jgi:purine-binding chemotaxis protein CheW
MTLFLLAHLAGRGVAIDSAEVDSVIDIGAIVPVPRAGEAVLGVAALRSRVVTVIDTWRVLGLTPPPTPPRAIVTRVDAHDYAVLFDTVEDVATLQAAPIPSGLALGGAWARAARGVVEVGGEPMLVIGLDALIPVAA